MALAIPTLVTLGASDLIRVEDSGKIPSGIPTPHIPHLSLLSSLDLIAGAAAVAVIVLVQGTGVAESAPNPDGSPSDANRDFIAQGIGNLASGLFRGQPVGGSVGQTAPWLGLQAVGGVFVTKVLAGSSQTYGGFAAVIGLLSWLLIASELILIAAELNVVLARRLWPRSLTGRVTRGGQARATSLGTRRTTRPKATDHRDFQTARRPATPARSRRRLTPTPHGAPALNDMR